MSIPNSTATGRSAARLSTHDAVATALTGLTDRELLDLLAAARPLGAGIGGAVSLLEVAGSSVFVKQVPLTATELLPRHARSTANLFALPAFCHYGIGGPGFGAWRELAAHELTTGWVRAGEHEGFPLLHHARALPSPRRPLPAELADADAAVAYWGGRPEVRRRIEELADSAASLVLFLEYLPQTLHSWLGERLRAGEAAAGRACAMVERELTATTAFLHARGLLHFDAHFENILTDGRRLYFADFGLAVADSFELAPAEAAFLDHHRGYDHCYALTHLVRWLVTELHHRSGSECDAIVHAYAAGRAPSAPPGGHLPTAATALLRRHAPLAAVMAEFYRDLQRESRETPFPVARLRRFLPTAATDGWVGR
ncbi:protein kinase family protein [Kitasatospora sp. NBC_01287]|uniref:protein kinase family protein n=1 Tax=Kitasatospora sp. NBC_01287 TaxID=2903573 RepID=UPI00225AD13C|nr:protein kinase family protein [Kitasatospora sp. NBC_01287]MCX4744310.1 protein kinase family protein [Kitasatospora sp. NBC_01287]